jgi:hypothetical protein
VITRAFHPKQNVELYADEAAQPNPEVFHIFLHGMDTRVTPYSDETPQQAWTRVLEHINLRRRAVRIEKLLLDENDLCTVYAGSLEDGVLAKLRTKHMREFIIQSLHKIAGGRNNASGSGRVSAMVLLAKLYGVKPLRKDAGAVTLTTRVPV